MKIFGSNSFVYVFTFFPLAILLEFFVFRFHDNYQFKKKDAFNSFRRCIEINEINI